MKKITTLCLITCALASSNSVSRIPIERIEIIAQANNDLLREIINQNREIINQNEENNNLLLSIIEQNNLMDYEISQLYMIFEESKEDITRI
ncbi:MAG TPA: hypothetical protein VKR54_02020 [Candidatus Babeliales bacterium]|jgi:hypothetical protein|nr:hypothetical protein [Candidatus Babeliales bacterium]